MSVLKIDNEIIVDDVENAVTAINAISTVKLTDIGVIKKFVLTQKATRFYLDSKGSVKMAPDKDTVYLWLDSGFMDSNGNPIFISLLKNGSEYSGHFAGNRKFLGNKIREFFRQNQRDIDSNMKKFDNKYYNKISERVIKHIIDEQQFFIDVCNSDVNSKKNITQIGQRLKDLSIVFDDTVEDVTDEPMDKPIIENPEIERSALDILWDKIDELEDYIATLLSTIEELNAKSNEHTNRIKELQDKNEEYKRALTQIREYTDAEVKPEINRVKVSNIPDGHGLLEGKKVLVLGATEVSVDVMRSMLKFCGFEKSDFEFETDYDKIKKYSGRVTTDGRYGALILGACPHKSCDSYGWSSLVEKFKNLNNGPLTIDVRTSSGELKITKTSFKMAMEKILETFNNR